MEIRTKVIEELRGRLNCEGRVFWTSDGMSYVLTGKEMLLAKMNSDLPAFRAAEGRGVQLSGSDPGDKATLISSIDPTESEHYCLVRVQDGEDFYLTASVLASILR